MKIYLCWLLLALSCLFWSCKDDLGETYLNDFELEIVSGGDQAGNYNLLLANKITVEVIHPDGSMGQNYPIWAIPSDGQMEAQFLFTDANGQVEFSWELGCSDIQAVNFYLYTKDCNLISIDNGTCQALDSLSVSASASLGNGWIRTCGIEGAVIQKTKHLSKDGIEYLLVDGTLYESTSGGQDWQLTDLTGTALGSENSGYIEDMEFNPVDQYLHIIFSNKFQYRLFNDEFWLFDTNNATLNLDSAVEGYIISNSGIPLASFRDDGIFASVDDGLWNLVNFDIGVNNYIVEFVKQGDVIYGLGFNSRIYESSGDFSFWDDYTAPQIYLNNDQFGDMIALPNGNIMIATTFGLTQYNPSSQNWATLPTSYPGPSSSMNKIIKLDDYDNLVYLLYYDFGMEESVIIRGSGNSYEIFDTGFDRGLINFFEIREDGSFLIGTADGFYIEN